MPKIPTKIFVKKTIGFSKEAAQEITKEAIRRGTDFSAVVRDWTLQYIRQEHDGIKRSR
jgi:hypothetical protein